MTAYVHEGDLPEGALGHTGPIAVDCEAMGLDPHRDRLCVVQLSSGGEDEHLVRLDKGCYEAPVLKALLADPNRLKILHFARFDIAAVRKWLGVTMAPVYCTKVASKLVRTYTDRHGLRDLARETIGQDISKQQQSSDWGAPRLTDAQVEYAASDVRYLHEIKQVLDERLAREGRTQLAQSCFDFLPVRAELDLLGWDQVDIFAHS
ncbi:ribonuclease D [Pacificimonas flava]|uniref:Ribonuclease D-like protein n=1 Tax=Pacificimonas flava TaxID=1234595 RepID=M2T896_9SPHN|nr:ribonuclease D [Pacificimonas flava]EMD82744.1 Ribonuclease D -like protein [Pacificimonas flava]MBB5279363.1 ribonuclease D [Pacificimonas flava]